MASFLNISSSPSLPIEVIGSAKTNSGRYSLHIRNRVLFGRSMAWLAVILFLMAFAVSNSHAIRANFGKKINTAVFLSPKFVLGPGSVINKYNYNIDFPNGHIGLKSFNAEVVDETGNPIPLHETYLHHWVVGRYYQRSKVPDPENHDFFKLKQSDYKFVRNSGVCQNDVLGQYFGLGSETRKTATYIPDPFGIEVGNSAEIPLGYEEKWMLNVHAIDTRGAEDRLGCTECRCDLYNITIDEYGHPLSPDYVGGLLCCYDQTQCRVKEHFEGEKRSLYLRYTVKWIDWDEFIVPVEIYILDVTDYEKRLNEHKCRIEYEVESCHNTDLVSDVCKHTKRTSLTSPTGGYIVYGVAHQHTGGTGSTLYGEDERVICSSYPTYGEGKEAGNEAGYIIGMSTCYPQPGSVNIYHGETLTLESNYSSNQRHTGVMGLFYILVAQQLPRPFIPFNESNSSREWK